MLAIASMPCCSNARQIPQGGERVHGTGCATSGQCSKVVSLCVHLPCSVFTSSPPAHVPCTSSWQCGSIMRYYMHVHAMCARDNAPVGTSASASATATTPSSCSRPARPPPPPLAATCGRCTDSSLSFYLMQQWGTPRAARLCQRDVDDTSWGWVNTQLDSIAV